MDYTQEIKVTNKQSTHPSYPLVQYVSVFPPLARQEIIITKTWFRITKMAAGYGPGENSQGLATGNLT